MKKQSKNRGSKRAAPFAKNEEIVLEISDMGNEGEGIGKLDGYPFFVRNAIPGDVIRAGVLKARASYGYARLIEVLTPSENRTEPLCPVAKSCGGCQIQHMQYAAQLAFKQEKVAKCIRRIGGISPEEYVMEDIIGMENPWHYRNKAQFPVAMSGEGKILTGFYAGRSHHLIPCDHCFIQASGTEEICRTVVEFMETYNVPAYDENTHRGLVRHIMLRKSKESGRFMVCLVINGDKLTHSEKFVQLLRDAADVESVCLNVNTNLGNVIMGDKVIPLYGPPYLMDSIGDIHYQISPLSFYQVNPIQTERLYETALEYAGLTGGETVWDLYCGIGTISLFLARRAGKVYGVEIVPDAIRDARENARRNGITNAEFFVGAAEDVVPQKYRKSGGSVKADVVTLDPPRKGCDAKLLATVIAMEPRRIVYVSCDPATMARDLKVLAAGGYRLERVRCVDMFPQGGHVESIVLLSHKSPDSVINVKVEFGEGEGKVPLDAIAERAKKYQPKPKITYKMIQEYVEKKYGFKVHTAYIAEVKRSLGLTMYDAPNAVEELRQPRKCLPKEKREAITDALKYFEVI